MSGNLTKKKSGVFEALVGWDAGGMPGDAACGGVVDEDTLRDAADAGCEKGRALDSSYS
jgi:hypothetical protein